MMALLRVPLGCRAAAEAGGLHGGRGTGESSISTGTTTRWLLGKTEPSTGFERAPSSPGARSRRRSTSLGVSRATFAAIPLPVSPVPGLVSFPPRPGHRDPAAGAGIWCRDSAVAGPASSPRRGSCDHLW